MSELKIAVSRSCPDCFSTHRECVNIDKSNYIDVAAIILSVNDVEHGKLDEIDATGY
ncbi:TPA: ornithine decarboxylase, partial [Escherichia coli]|nr:ornithine decarboxylase [Escherichia coli]HEA4914524.1 ornithine decarboxylase [Escherichia coli]